MDRLTAVTILLKTIGELIDVVEGHLGGKAVGEPKRVEDLLSDTSKAKLEDLRADALRRRLEERSDD